MEPLIYFPTFEPPSDSWLKFALLYFDNFKPIVPYARRNHLSENFRQIENETDLISLYSPNYEDGHLASFRAIDEAEKILSNTYGRSPFFGTVNVLRKWKKPSNWTFMVYREKFSDNWVHFCESNQIGRQTEEGILLPEELGFLFMAYLAREIAFKESAAVITDSNRFDSFTNYSRTKSPAINKKAKFAKGLFNLLVPQNLSTMPFGQLIKFRNRNRHLIEAFNKELDKVQQKVGEGYKEQDFINQYNNIYSEFSREIILQGMGVASIPFAAYILIKNPEATAPDYIKETLGALGIVLGGVYAFGGRLEDIKTKRYCKKYLTNLQRIR